MTAVIDFRVTVPDDYSPEEELHPPREYTDQYAAIFSAVVPNRSLDDLLAQMDEAGVDFAVMHAEYGSGDPADAMTDTVAAIVRMHPRRFAGFGTVSLENLRPMRAVEQAVRAKDLGLCGLSLQPSFLGIGIDERGLYPLYAKASELGLIVAVHTGVNYTVHQPIRNDHPLQLDQVASDFPDLNLIACHAGWPWVPEMVAVARKHPRVSMEFGGIAPKYVGQTGTGWEVMHRFMNSLLAGQVLFGTDWPMIPFTRALSEWREMELKPQVREALLGGNAARLLREVGVEVPV